MHCIHPSSTVFVSYQQQNLGRRVGATKMHLSPPVGSAAVHSKAVALLLLIQCFFLLPWFVGFYAWSLFCSAILSVLSSFAIISPRKRELVALLAFSSWCPVTVIVFVFSSRCLWVGLQCVIVVFPGHTPLLCPCISFIPPQTHLCWMVWLLVEWPYLLHLGNTTYDLHVVATENNNRNFNQCKL